MSQRDIENGRQVFEDLRKQLGQSRAPMTLLVEDNENDIKLILNELNPFRVPLEIARSSKDAIRLLESTHFDVILLDLTLDGDGSGLDVLSYAQNVNLDAIIFIVLTGSEDASPLVKEALDRGAKFIIRKPLTREHARTIYGTL